MIGRWSLALGGSLAAHVTFFGAVLTGWPPRSHAEEPTTAVQILDDEAPNVMIEAEITQGESVAATAGGGANNLANPEDASGTEEALLAEAAAEAAEALASAKRSRKVSKHDDGGAERHKTSKRPAKPPVAARQPAERPEPKHEVMEKRPPSGETAKPEVPPAAPGAPTVTTVPPPPMEAEAEKADDAKKGREAHAAAGSGAGTTTTFKFARTTAIGGGESVADAQYIGDHDAAAPKNTRVATTTERSSGNARGSGDTLPVPEGHTNDAKGPLAHAAVAAPSPESREGARTTAGRVEGAASAAAPAPNRRRFSMVGEVSDAQVAARIAADQPPKTLVIRRKRAPSATLAVIEAAEAPPEAPLEVPNPTPAPATAEALLTTPLPAVADAPAPVASEDGFWAGEGQTTAGTGTAAADSPDPTAGENVQRTIFKKDGAGWTEVTTLEDAVELSDQAAVSVRQTELGTWFTPVDDVVRLGWRPPLDQLVLGVGGRVTVEFTVRRNGRVADVGLVDSNVPLTLQEAALAAVPDAVAPPPNGYAPLRVRYVFRYGTSGGKLN